MGEIHVELRPGQTVVRVADWPDARAEWYVSSSQIETPPLDAWSRADGELISGRLADGGREKGRVLFAWQDRGWQGRLPVSALLLHVQERSERRFQVKRILSIEEYKANGSIWAVQAASVLLACVHEVVFRAGYEHRCFDWVFSSRHNAEDAKRRFCSHHEAEITSTLGQGRSRIERHQILLTRCPR